MDHPLGPASHPPHDDPRSQGRLIRSTIETRRTSIRLRGMQRQTAPSVILGRDSQPHVAARQAQLQRLPSRRSFRFRSLSTVGERVALQKAVLRGFRAPTHRIHDRDSSTTRRCRPPQSGHMLLSNIVALSVYTHLSCTRATPALWWTGLGHKIHSVRSHRLSCPHGRYPRHQQEGAQRASRFHSIARPLTAARCSPLITHPAAHRWAGGGLAFQCH